MNYEPPEALEIGSISDVVLGEKGFKSEENGHFRMTTPLPDFYD